MIVKNKKGVTLESGTISIDSFVISELEIKNGNYDLEILRDRIILKKKDSQIGTYRLKWAGRKLKLTIPPENIPDADRYKFMNKCNLLIEKQNDTITLTF